MFVFHMNIMDAIALGALALMGLGAGVYLLALDIKARLAARRRRRK